MLCKKCGKENFDDAVFCTSCGERIEHENTCPSCGKVVQEDAVYCNNCGKRLDGKNLCSSCGELFVGNFCPKCGTSVIANTNSVSNAPVESKSPKKVVNNEKLNKIFDKTGTSILLFGVVFALVFVFLIGFGVSIKTNISDVNDYYIEMISEEYGISAKSDIYYYFGQAYEDIDTLIEAMDLKNGEKYQVDYTSPALYITMVLGTVISAAVLLAVVVLAILAVVQLSRKLSGKDVKNAEKLAFASMLSYILGAILLYANSYVKLNITQKTYLNKADYLNLSVDFNPATLAGIILCAIAMGLGLICYVIKNRKEYKKLNTLVPSALGLVSAVFAVIVTVFATSGLFNLTQGSGSSTIKLNSGISPYLLQWATYLQTDLEANPAAYAELCALMLMQVILATLAVVSIITQLNDLAKNKKPTAWCVNIATLVVSGFYMLEAITVRDQTLKTIFEGNLNLKFTVTASIIVFVFSILCLASSVAQRILPKVLPDNDIFAKNEVAENNQIVENSDVVNETVVANSDTEVIA